MSEAQESRGRFLTREEYRHWVEAQPRGRFERVAGEAVAMAPERVGHALVKANLWRALDDAVRRGGIPCQALRDRVTVEMIARCTGERRRAAGSRGVGRAEPSDYRGSGSPTTASVDTGRSLPTISACRLCAIT
jgi:Putative restriction endonuclease